MSAARAEILSRIRAALCDRTTHERSGTDAAERTYRTSSGLVGQELVEQFRERVAEYKATVHVVSAADLAARIAECCQRRAVRRLAVPRDLPSDWIPEGVQALPDTALSNEELEASDGVLTGCALGIAQTGTIVLDAGPHQGRRAITLVPDYHLCVVRDDQIVGLVPEAIARLHDSARASGRPMTWISGPSATSDIELNRVEGVHGPRTLEVVITVQPAG